MAIVHRVPARVGLLGNPSDGYYGKTLSFALHNFHAEVTLTPSDRLCFQPHPIHDPLEFESLEKLADRVTSEGYYGGMRLLMAICARLHAHCAQHNIILPNCGNFTLSYTTNIPRQAGLSGSSAIICATLACLLQVFGISNQIRLVDRPGLVLGAETDLGITAGLQDRVIQVYGGLVYMDFDKELMSRTGHGNYTPLDPSLLPPLQIIYAQNPSDSGKVHSTVRRRWNEGDLELRADMDQVAKLAEEGKKALEERNHSKLAYLMDKNFDLRRKMFGDETLGVLNVEMVATARSVGAAAKFTGSGGAIVAFCPLGEAQIRQLKVVCQAKKFVVIDAMYGVGCVDAQL